MHAEEASNHDNVSRDLTRLHPKAGGQHQQTHLVQVPLAIEEAPMERLQEWQCSAVL